MLSLLAVLLFSQPVLAAPAVAPSSDDPLFVRMEGRWVGTGVRHELLPPPSDVSVQAQVTTSYEIVRGRLALVSHNQITETASGAAPNTYTTVYWVQPKAGVPGVYEMGSEGSTQVSSTGTLGADGIFRVAEDLGGGYTVDSQTVFLPGRSIYSETFSSMTQSGSQIQIQTRIEYERVGPEE